MSRFNVESIERLLPSVAFVIVISTIGMIVSIPAPFYPAEAIKKNVTATEYGVVFSSAEFAQIIGLPIIGTYVTKIGPMNGFTGSILIASSTTILFGFVNKLNGRIWFVSISIVLRLINSFVTGAVFVSILVLINTGIPGASARYMNISQCIFSIEVTIGPVLGGVLVNVGGFTMPFVTFGCIQLIGGLITIYIFTMTKTTNSSKNPTQLLENSTEKSHNAFPYLLKIPSVIVYSICIMVALINIVFVLTILDAHLKRFEISPVQTGFVFLANGMLNVIGFLLFGVLCDRISRVYLIAIFGIFSLTVSALIIGPDPSFPFGPKLWLIIVGLALSGFGRAAVLAAGSVIIHKDAGINGFPENDATSGLLAGLFLESVAIGAILGHIIAGVLFDHFGFRKATTFLTVLNVLTGVVLILFICSNHIHALIKSRKIIQNDEDCKHPLLSYKTEKTSFSTIQNSEDK